MVNFDETSWVTSDGMIWLQVIDFKTAIEILFSNSFELFQVNLIDESERLLNTMSILEAEPFLKETLEGSDTDNIICIPVGKLDVYGKELYKIPKKHGNT